MRHILINIIYISISEFFALIKIKSGYKGAFTLIKGKYHTIDNITHCNTRAVLYNVIMIADLLSPWSFLARQ